MAKGAGDSAEKRVKDIRRKIPRRFSSSDAFEVMRTAGMASKEMPQGSSVS